MYACLPGAFQREASGWFGLLKSSAQTYYNGSPAGPPVATDDGQGFFSTPFVYILVPGVIFVVISVVIALVLCKKSLEKRKRRVCYCKGGHLLELVARCPQFVNCMGFNATCLYILTHVPISLREAQ